MRIRALRKLGSVQVQGLGHQPVICAVPGESAPPAHGILAESELTVSITCAGVLQLVSTHELRTYSAAEPGCTSVVLRCVF